VLSKVWRFLFLIAIIVIIIIIIIIIEVLIYDPYYVEFKIYYINSLHLSVTR